jgi:predicted outer membrane lipoprotein
LAGVGFSDGPRFRIVSVGTMFAAAFAAMTALEMVFFSEDDIAFGTIIKVLWVEFFLKHETIRVA